MYDWIYAQKYILISVTEKPKFYFLIYTYIYVSNADSHVQMHAHTRTRTKSHTWHDVCLNNCFLVQCAGLLWVCLEPGGDLSVWATQAENSSKFALGSRGTQSRTHEFLAMVCTLLHPLNTHDTHVQYTDRNIHMEIQNMYCLHAFSDGHIYALHTHSLVIASGTPQLLLTFGLTMSGW